jgi:CubicO group peptidase (beta-lactamase class C family)
VHSNVGVELLGYVLARATHADYVSLLHDRITGSLGLRDAAIDLSPGQQKGFATPHDLYMQPTKIGHVLDEVCLVVWSRGRRDLSPASARACRFARQ